MLNSAPVCERRRLLGLKKVGGAFFSTKAAVASVAGCWAVSIVFNGPQFFWSDIAYLGGRQACMMPHVDEMTMNIYTGAKNVIMFFIPLMTKNIYTGAKNVIMFFIRLMTMNIYL